MERWSNSLSSQAKLISPFSNKRQPQKLDQVMLGSCPIQQPCRGEAAIALCPPGPSGSKAGQVGTCTWPATQTNTRSTRTHKTPIPFTSLVGRDESLLEGISTYIYVHSVDIPSAAELRCPVCPAAAPGSLPICWHLGIQVLKAAALCQLLVQMCLLTHRVDPCNNCF